jgi:hypothetical protein
MEIALDVATAYRESEGGIAFLTKFKIQIGQSFSGLFRKKKKDPGLDLDKMLNISRAEQKALRALSDALRPDHAEGLEPAPEAA